MPSRLAEDYYRDAVNVYTSWLENPNKNKSIPRIKSVSAILTPKPSYNLDLTKMKLSILDYEISILGYPKTLSLYKGWKIAEAKLVKRGKDWYLFITFRKRKEKKKAKKKEGLITKGENKEEKKKEEFKPTGLITVDINQDFIVVGNDKAIVEIPTRLDNAFHYVLEAQKLQKKYPYKWKYSKHILNRIAHFFRRERNILIDFAKKLANELLILLCC